MYVIDPNLEPYMRVLAYQRSAAELVRITLAREDSRVMRTIHCYILFYFLLYYSYFELRTGKIALIVQLVYYTCMHLYMYTFICTHLYVYIYKALVLLMLFCHSIE